MLTVAAGQSRRSVRNQVTMWREFLWKMARPKRASNGNTIDSDSDSESSSCDSDSSGISGHYSFQHGSTLKTVANQRYVHQEDTVQSDQLANVAFDNDVWQEKFDYMLSLIREPRYLLAETLVAEQLKLTLKQQAYKLEQLLLQQTIDELNCKDEASSDMSTQR